MYENYFDNDIQEIIAEFPGVVDILEEFNIGGQLNSEGIVGIDSMPPEDVQVMMWKIMGAIYPEMNDRQVCLPDASTLHTPPPPASYSPPMKKLVDEHRLIVRWIELIPRVIKHLDLETDAGRQIVLNGIDFICQYADSFHHAKEEDILFKYFSENHDIKWKSIYLHVEMALLEDHARARACAVALNVAMEHKDVKTVSERLREYRDILVTHVRTENEKLYPWMDQVLSSGQINSLSNLFDNADSSRGKDFTKKYETLIMKLEEVVAPGER